MLTYEGSSLRVVGLDMSLTSTGVAVFDDEFYTLPDKSAVYTTRCTSKPFSKPPATDTLAQRYQRINDLVDNVTGNVGLAHYVFIEQPAFSKSGGSATDRAGLWHRTLHVLMQRGIDVVEIPPTNVKMYATGKGNANKDDVVSAVVRRYPEVDVNGNDECDALTLLAMGMRHLGYPLEEKMPALNLKALEKVHWTS